MSVNLLEHVNINTQDLDACIKFYSDILGFENGPRPDVGFPGAWMYCGGQAVIHIMQMPGGPEGPTGCIDHVAFGCSDIESFRQRLREAGLAFHENHVPDFKIRQLFVRDPDGVKVELNFREE